MRRSDREITDKQAIEAFLMGEQILRVAFYDQGEIYIVPVNYGYRRENDRYTFYFHGAKAGRKYELAQAEPAVGFEVDGKYRLLEQEKACGFSAAYQSVTGTGKLCLAQSREEKIAGLNAVMQQTTGRAQWDYEEKALDAAAVFRLDVQTMSCKASKIG